MPELQEGTTIGNFHRIPECNQRRDAQGHIIPDMGNLYYNDRHKNVEIETDPEGNELRADPEKKLPENVPGAFFCDSKCISCDMCGEVAPNHFTRIQDNVAQSYVFKQPISQQEIELCQEAIKACPVHAIGTIEV